MEQAWRALVAAFALALSLCGCTVVPPESVKLSATLGQDIREIRRAHLFYINSFYDNLESRVNAAVDDVYAPAIISAALKGASGQVLLQRLEGGKMGGESATDAVEFTTRFLALIRATVETRRAEDLKPIQDARRAAIADAEGAYLNVELGNATLTAYLASIAKVRESQDDIFAMAGIPKFQSEVASSLAGISQELDRVGNEVRDQSVDLDKRKATIQSILDKLREKRDDGRKP